MAKKFPTFAVILLLIGIAWLLSELRILTISIPWVPVIIIVIAIGMIVNKTSKRK